MAQGRPLARDTVMPHTSAYRLLGDYLAAQPAGENPLLLGFPAIEQILGRPLPASAQHVSFWTARATTGLGRALRDAGFHAELWVTDGGLRVAFMRRPSRAPARARTNERGQGVPVPGTPPPRR